MATINIASQKDNINADAQALKHLATIKDIREWQEVIDSYHSLQQQFALKRIFLVLDDVDQAEYTSGHATNRKVFESDAEEVLENLETDDPSWDEVFNNQVLPKQIAHYAKQLANQAYHVDISRLYDKINLYSAEDIKAIVEINQNPLTAMDKQIEVRAGVFDSEILKFALLPNGYFEADFDPFENLAIITMMDSFGFEFIGLGASLLGFIKTAAFNLDKVNELLAILKNLYHLDKPTQATLQTLIIDNSYVILPYSENFIELIE